MDAVMFSLGDNIATDPQMPYFVWMCLLLLLFIVYK